MALINRVSRLLRADLHAVLDRVEEPEVLLRQAVREMDAALGEDRRRARRLAHEHARLAARVRDGDEALARIAAELDLCFDAGQDDLARRLLKKRLEHERSRTATARRAGAMAEDLERLRQSIDDNQARLDAMREKADLLAAEDAHAAAPETVPHAFDEPAVTAEDVEIAFLGEQRRRSRS